MCVSHVTPLRCRSGGGVFVGSRALRARDARVEGGHSLVELLTANILPSAVVRAHAAAGGAAAARRVPPPTTTSPGSRRGGTKRSGIGRDLGELGLASYLQPKQVVRRVNPAPLGWYGCATGK